MSMSVSLHANKLLFDKDTEFQVGGDMWTKENGAHSTYATFKVKLDVGMNSQEVTMFVDLAQIEQMEAELKRLKKEYKEELAKNGTGV